MHSLSWLLWVPLYMKHLSYCYPSSLCTIQARASSQKQYTGLFCFVFIYLFIFVSILIFIYLGEGLAIPQADIELEMLQILLPRY